MTTAFSLGQSLTLVHSPVNTPFLGKTGPVVKIVIDKDGTTYFLDFTLPGDRAPRVLGFPEHCLVPDGTVLTVFDTHCLE